MGSGAGSGEAVLVANVLVGQRTGAGGALFRALSSFICRIRIVAVTLFIGYLAIIVGCMTVSVDSYGPAADWKLNPLSYYVENPDGVVTDINVIAAVGVAEDSSDETILEVAAATYRIIDYLLTDEDFSLFVEEQISGSRAGDWIAYAEYAELEVRTVHRDGATVFIEADDYQVFVDQETELARRQGMSEAAVEMMEEVLWRAQRAFPHGISIPPVVDKDLIAEAEELMCEQREEEAASPQYTAKVRRVLADIAVVAIGGTAMVLDVTTLAPTLGTSVLSLALGGIGVSHGLSAVVKHFGGDD